MLRNSRHNSIRSNELSEKAFAASLRYNFLFGKVLCLLCNKAMPRQISKRAHKNRVGNREKRRSCVEVLTMKL